MSVSLISNIPWCDKAIISLVSDGIPEALMERMVCEFYKILEQGTKIFYQRYKEELQRFDDVVRKREQVELLNKASRESCTYYTGTHG